MDKVILRIIYLIHLNLLIIIIIIIKLTSILLLKVVVRNITIKFDAHIY